MAHGGMAYVLMAGLMLMYSMCIFCFMDMIMLYLYEGYELYHVCIEFTYLWVLG